MRLPIVNCKISGRMGQCFVMSIITNVCVSCFNICHHDTHY